MNPLLKYSKEHLLPEQPIGSGYYYARFSQSEFVPTPETGEIFGIWFFEAFDGEWFDRHRTPETDELADYYDNAALFVLQARVLPIHLRIFPAFAQVEKAAFEEEDSEEWFVFEAFPNEGRILGEGELPLTIYSNLYQPGIEAAAKDFRPADPTVAARLRKVVSTAHIPDATEADVDNALAGVAAANIEWAVVYNVGQGNAIGLCNGNGSVVTYFDLGGGVLANAGTFPSSLTNFCFTQQSPIILSHWDFDHWSSASRDANSLRRTWFAPKQTVGPTHVALMTSIMTSGKLLLVPPGFTAKWRGQVYLERCTGKDRNHSGVALTLSEQANGGGKQMLFPGDARYTYIPSFPNPTTSHYLSVVVPHHGGDMRSRTMSLCPSLTASRLVYSYGTGNTFSHPRHITRMDHQTAGWHDPYIFASPPHEVRETTSRGTGAFGHVLLGWKSHPKLPPLQCSGTSCQLQAQQL